eukprot:TRINITY_DN13633_c0_g1_i1.p1 TRINITY_DN13633_c0_g1~~TRINITY_DN13633_c0_g1_i1.p1  ORF type:complete len:153 (-),score=5.94 TRINITY_DN13633_c0_g1_i1:417-875(-)
MLTCNLNNYGVTKMMITVDGRSNINDNNTTHMGFECSNTIITPKAKGNPFKTIVDMQYNRTNNHRIFLLRIVREMFTNKVTVAQYSRFMECTQENSEFQLSLTGYSNYVFIKRTESMLMNEKLFIGCTLLYKILISKLDWKVMRISTKNNWL